MTDRQHLQLDLSHAIVTFARRTLEDKANYGVDGKPIVPLKDIMRHAGFDCGIAFAKAIIAKGPLDVDDPDFACGVVEAIRGIVAGGV